MSGSEHCIRLHRIAALNSQAVLYCVARGCQPRHCVLYSVGRGAPNGESKAGAVPLELLPEAGSEPCPAHSEAGTGTRRGDLKQGSGTAYKGAWTGGVAVLVAAPAFQQSRGLGWDNPCELLRCNTREFEIWRNSLEFNTESVTRRLKRALADNEKRGCGVVSEPQQESEPECKLCGGPLHTLPHWGYWACGDCGTRETLLRSEE